MRLDGLLADAAVGASFAAWLGLRLLGIRLAFPVLVTPFALPLARAASALSTAMEGGSGLGAGIGCTMSCGPGGGVTPETFCGGSHREGLLTGINTGAWRTGGFIISSRFFFSKRPLAV